jgi:hypothetical protein
MGLWGRRIDVLVPAAHGKLDESHTGFGDDLACFLKSVENRCFFKMTKPRGDWFTRDARRESRCRLPAAASR